MLQVRDETHYQIKAQAYLKGMSIKDYIQWLADRHEPKKLPTFNK